MVRQRWEGRAYHQGVVDPVAILAGGGDTLRNTTRDSESVEGGQVRAMDPLRSVFSKGV